ncbi:hypothetical protein [Hyphomicrobium sp. 2TAF46]|uniref:hypothetical protein n=1 Tax=Hyphomicrobium sp. 2TAF46 TaxID=3233019 RepID=UPI003F9037E2
MTGKIRLTRSDTFEHTIAGLLTKRQELADRSLHLREQLAATANDMDALDRTLKVLGYEGDLKGMSPRGLRNVYFSRNELRRFVLDELRSASGPLSSRQLAQKAIQTEGKDGNDRPLMGDMVKRIGRVLYALGRQNVATRFGRKSEAVWELKK